MSLELKPAVHWGGILLVAGTCIGAGMIGVPIKTAAAGLLPTLAGFLIVWTVMTFGALLLLEATLYFRKEVNFISMVQQTLGNHHKHIAWGVYLLFMYAIIAGYTTAGASMIQQVMQATITSWFPAISINKYAAIVIFLLPFAWLIYVGSKFVDLVNRFLTVGLILAFIGLAVLTVVAGFLGKPTTTINGFLLVGDFSSLLLALPILATTFSYHIIIPSLKTYLRSNLKWLTQALLIGGTIPLGVYVIWQLAVLFLIPAVGEHGLIRMLHTKQNPVDGILGYLQSHSELDLNLILGIIYTLWIFMFCALTSSLLGASWALLDFLADGLKITKNALGKLWLLGITFIPPVIYTLLFPNGFLKALGFAGAFSAILTICYPAMLVKKLRRGKALAPSASPALQVDLAATSIYQVPIKTKWLSSILGFGWIIVILECINNIFY